MKNAMKKTYVKKTNNNSSKYHKKYRAKFT